MKNLKTVFWFVGVPCAGKSHYAKKLSEKLNIPFIHLDCVEDYTIPKEEAYRALFNRIYEKQLVYIIDGIIPFNKEEDMCIVKSILGNTRIIYILIKPDYKQYSENVEKRRLEKHDTGKMCSVDFSLNWLFWDDLLPTPYLIFSKESDLDKITLEDIRNINYQHMGFTNEKWKQLKVDCKGKSVLDLGCSSCYYETFAMEDGAIGYTGLDINFAYLFNKNARYFDLNKLGEWRTPADIVISTSVYHYIGDKEKFIKEAARLTKDTFIFETPLSKLEGRLIECEPNRNLLFTTKGLLEFWLGKYFTSFECLGLSVVEDDSYRLIYHCKK